MNISFFLTPKQDVVYLSYRSTMRQALEKIEYHRYSSVPLVDEEGRYAGTITEGDLLWKMKNTAGLNFKNVHRVLVSEVPQHIQNKAVNIHARMEDLFCLAETQNFIPVVDDEGVFIGIVKRSDIIQYCVKNYINCQEEKKFDSIK